MLNARQIARQFLSEWFSPEETFALLVRHPEASRTLQRIVRLPDLMKSNYLGWLAFENSRGANIYFSINPLSSGAKKRTKSAVAEAKGLYLDLDSDGDRKLAALRESNSRAATQCCDPHFDGEISGHLARQGIHDSRAGSDVERARRDIRRRPCVHRLCKGVPPPWLLQSKVLSRFSGHRGDAARFSWNIRQVISGWNCRRLQTFNPPHRPAKAARFADQIRERLEMGNGSA